MRRKAWEGRNARPERGGNARAPDGDAPGRDMRSGCDMAVCFFVFGATIKGQPRGMLVHVGHCCWSKPWKLGFLVVVIWGRLAYL